MGGKIWIESEPGKGTEFIFTAKMQPCRQESAQRRRLPPESLQGLRALVVDDNGAAREVLSSMLTSLKIEVDTAIDGQSAIACLEQAMAQGNPYDVVLLDWIMPGIDGIETARRIKANALLAKVPAMLMVTANGREEAYVEAEKVGLDGFLLKPVYASVMYQCLARYPWYRSDLGTCDHQGEMNAGRILQDIRGAHILLVDDNIINQEVASEFLQDVGMDVTIASNGRECLDALTCRPYDLVLMDIQMPVMDGLEATRRIRQNSRFKDLPIIAMTAHAMTGDRDKSLAAGMNDHITKPIDSAALYLALKKWIKGRKTGGTSGKPGRTDVSCRLPADGLSLPDLPGIDQAEALKILNNKTDLFVKMLYDFQKELQLAANSPAGNVGGRAVVGNSEKGPYDQRRRRVYRFLCLDAGRGSAGKCVEKRGCARRR